LHFDLQQNYCNKKIDYEAALQNIPEKNSFVLKNIKSSVYNVLLKRSIKASFYH